MNLKKISSAILVIALSLASCKTGKQNAAAPASPETGKYVTSADITEGDVHQYISVLASDSMGGREAGTPYEALAGKYIREKFISLGLKPFENNTYHDYYQTVPLFSRKFFNNCELNFNDFKGEYTVDFRPLIQFDSLKVAGDAVFLGYGNDADYDNLDVKGKWVMMLEGRGNDTIIPKANEDIYSRYETAKNRGVLGILSIVTDEAVKSETGYLQSKPTSIPIIKISIKTADHLFALAGTAFPEVLSKVEAGKNYRLSVPATVYAVIQTETITPLSHNVVACLNAADYTDSYIVIGAHYDHLGTKPSGDSTQIYHGADDNASGVAGMLELAEKLRSVKNLKHNILFVAFGGEELGLYGSRFFCNNPPVLLDKIKWMVNLDMIGRMDSLNHVYLNTVEPTDRYDAILAQLKNAHPDIHIVFPSDARFQSSDHSSFSGKNIPAIGFTTGLHKAYHTPADTLGSVNCSGEKRLLDLVYDFIMKEESN